MRVRMVGVALVFAGMFSTASAQAASITFDSFTVNPGETLEVDVFGASLTDVVAFGFDLGFDTTVLAFTKAVEGTFLSKVGPTAFGFCPDANSECFSAFPESTPPSVFSVLYAGSASSTADVQPELLTTLVFSVIGTGDARLVLGSRLLDSQLLDIEFTEDPGIITSVPEPSTLALLGIGLAAMARKRLKKKTPG